MSNNILRPKQQIKDFIWLPRIYGLSLVERLAHRGAIDGDCWVWMASKNQKGYGRMVITDSDGKRTKVVHRVIYEHINGPLPKGLEIDHLCKNRACFNPSHIEAVTHKENCRRGNVGAHFGNKTHCPSGHPYSGDNLYISLKGSRSCRECTRTKSREWARAKRTETRRKTK